MYNKLVGEADNGKELPREEFQKLLDLYAETRKDRLYVFWRNKTTLKECMRVGSPNFLCTCKHMYRAHAWYANQEPFQVHCRVRGCDCKCFSYLQIRARCCVKSCKHEHESHLSRGVPGKCQQPGCDCEQYRVSFACDACHKPYDEHEMFIESASVRKARGGVLDDDSAKKKYKTATTRLKSMGCTCSGCKNLVGCQKNKTFKMSKGGHVSAARWGK
jgi:hypothetical protein